MITLESRKVYLEKAKRAALIAGEYLANRHGVIETEVSHHDTKLIADIESERIILEELGSDFAALGEETGGEINPSAPTWIVDPLDGTVNYSRGLPISCISICLWLNGPLLGVVYDFIRDEMFVGLVGEGAWLNGKPISVSETSDKEQSIVLTGFPASLVSRPDDLSVFVSNISHYKKIRLLGSAALSLAYISCGRADVYSENNINLWDVAAGLALVKSAGGRYDMSENGPLNIYADNGSVE